MGNTLIVIPTYNECGNIMDLLNNILKFQDIDVLVVDDNSPDGTAMYVGKHPEYSVRVYLLVRENKQGLGMAYKAGFEWGLKRHYKYMGQMDADFSHPVEVLPKMIDLSERDHAVVIGSRWVAGGGVAGWPFYRRLISRFGSAYARLLLGIRTLDVTSGYKIMPVEYLKRTGFENFSSKGYSFQIELQKSFHDMDLSVVEYPIIFTERTRGESKMSLAIAVEAFGFITKNGVCRKLMRIKN